MGVSMYGLFCFSSIWFVGIAFGSVLATNSYNKYVEKTEDKDKYGGSVWVKIDS